MTLGLILAITGAALAAVLPGIGSAYGVRLGGQAAAGVLSEQPELFGKLLVIQALPGTQGIYGFLTAVLVMIKLNMLGGSPIQIDTATGVSFLPDGTPQILRPGAVTPEEIRRFCGDVAIADAVLHMLPSDAAAPSPGMKYKHYAPKADVTLLNGTFEQFKAYVDAHMDQNPSCLCFTGEAEKLGVPCVEYGREGDGADQAKHIFRSLRALDEQGDGIVYARCPKKDGLSMAVYNRLIRAAAFRVIAL